MKKEMSKKKFNKICIAMRILIYYVIIIMLAFVGYTAIVYLGEFFKGGSVVYLMYTIERALNLLPAAVAACFGAAAFRSMQRSETPFIFDVSRRIKAASLWIIIGEAVHSVYQFVMWLAGFSEDCVIGLFRIITGVLLFSFVYVIEQGCRLQEESDETL